jgi:hypothetical protein
MKWVCRIHLANTNTFHRCLKNLNLLVSIGDYYLVWGKINDSLGIELCNVVFKGIVTELRGNSL